MPHARSMVAFLRSGVRVLAMSIAWTVVASTVAIAVGARAANLVRSRSAVPACWTQLVRSHSWFISGTRPQAREILGATRACRLSRRHWRSGSCRPGDRLREPEPIADADARRPESCRDRGRCGVDGCSCRSVQAKDRGRTCHPQSGAVRRRLVVGDRRGLGGGKPGPRHLVQRPWLVVGRSGRGPCCRSRRARHGRPARPAIAEPSARRTRPAADSVKRWVGMSWPAGDQLAKGRQRAPSLLRSTGPRAWCSASSSLSGSHLVVTVRRVRRRTRCD